MYVCGALSTFPSAMLDPEAEPGGCVCDEESSTRNLPENGAPPIGVNQHNSKSEYLKENLRSYGYFIYTGARIGDCNRDGPPAHTTTGLSPASPGGEAARRAFLACALLIARSAISRSPHAPRYLAGCSPSLQPQLSSSFLSMRSSPPQSLTHRMQPCINTSGSLLVRSRN